MKLRLALSLTFASALIAPLALAQQVKRDVTQSGISFGVDACRVGCISAAWSQTAQSTAGGPMMAGHDPGTWVVTATKNGFTAGVRLDAGPAIGWQIIGGDTHRTSINK